MINEKLKKLQRTIKDKVFFYEREYRITGSFEKNEISELYRLFKLRNDRFFIDIGVGKGITTALCSIIAEENRGVVYGIDPCQSSEHQSSAYSLCKYLSLEPPRIIEKKTLSAAGVILGEAGEGSVDVVVVDGDHRFESTMVDLVFAHEALKVGGMIVIDDCYYKQKQLAANYFVKNYDYSVQPFNPTLSRNALKSIARFIFHSFKYDWGLVGVIRYIQVFSPWKNDSYVVLLKKESDNGVDYWQFNGM